MPRFLRRIVQDLAQRRNLEAYATAAVALVFAVLSLLQDSLPLSTQLAVLLAGVALLVFKTTEPQDRRAAELDDVLLDRQSYGKLSDFFAGATTLWVYGPSAINVMRNIDEIKREVLDRGGEVRVLTQDPEQTPSMEILERQLDRMHDLRRDIDNTGNIVQRIREYGTRGSIEHRFAPYSPGFSLLIADADNKNGRLVVEFYGYQNEVITERMHIVIQRHQSQYWFEYWEKQFRLMWDSARKVA